MSKVQKTRREIVSLIQGIAELGNLTTHAIYNSNGKIKYCPCKVGITSEVVRAHLDGEQPIGCYFVLGEQTQVAIIDFDDHDKSMSWGDMAAAATPIVDKMISIGMNPLWCRSGGGAGLHI